MRQILLRQFLGQRGAVRLWMTVTRASSANWRSRSRQNSGSSSKSRNFDSGCERLSIARVWQPSPGPYSATTTGRERSIFSPTRRIIIGLLGMIEATWKGRWRKPKEEQGEGWHGSSKVVGGHSDRSSGLVQSGNPGSPSPPLGRRALPESARVPRMTGFIRARTSNGRRSPMPRRPWHPRSGRPRRHAGCAARQPPEVHRHHVERGFRAAVDRPGHAGDAGCRGRNASPRP